MLLNNANLLLLYRKKGGDSQNNKLNLYCNYAKPSILTTLQLEKNKVVRKHQLNSYYTSLKNQ